MSLRARLDTAFGPGGPHQPLFYNHPPALRFELSRGGTPIRQFRDALDRAMTILSGVFPSDTPLVALFRLRLYADQPALGPVRQQLGVLRQMGIPVPREREIWHTAADDEDGPLILRSLAFATAADRLEELLWGALAVDLGIRPRNAADLYLLAPDSGVIAHPYDDRGLDLIGPKNALLPFYRRHRDWLLDYDRATMDAAFAVEDAVLHATCKEP